MLYRKPLNKPLSRPKRCKKPSAFPCKNTCIARYHWKTKTEQFCNSAPEGTPATYLEWVRFQANRKRTINKKRKARGQTLFKTDKFGALINPDKDKKGKLPSDYRLMAQRASDIGAKTKNPKTKALAKKVAQKAIEVFAKMNKDEGKQIGFQDVINIGREFAGARLQQLDEKGKQAHKNAAIVMEELSSNLPKWKSDGNLQALKNAKNTFDAHITQQYTPIRNAIGQEMERINAQIRQNNAKNGYDEARAKDDAQQVYLDKSLNREVIDGDDTHVHDRRAIRENLADFYLLTKGIGKIERIHYDTDRAYAQIWGNPAVNVGSPHDTRGIRQTLFHEMGHHLENNIVGAANIALDWMRSRSTKQEPISLREITSLNYDEDEIAYPDDFVSPYVGRYYTHKSATEVISVGLEHWTSPNRMTDLFMQDPEHFYLVLGFLVGTK